jgi:hypothetical protein
MVLDITQGWEMLRINKRKQACINNLLQGVRKETAKYAGIIEVTWLQHRKCIFSRLSSCSPLTNKSRSIGAANPVLIRKATCSLKMEHRADWPIRQDGSGMGACQAGQSLCACALT